MFLPILIFIFLCDTHVWMIELVTEDDHTIATEVEIPVPVAAVAGGRLSLPCDITSPIIDDEVYLVLWYKNDSPTPIYSLDARKGPLDKARHATDDTLHGRAYFTSVPQPAVLEVDRVKLSDEGIYRCRVDFRKARTQHSALILSVAVPPGAPILKDSNGKVLSGVIGPYNEGDSLHLICQTEGGKPPPSVIWWRSRRIVDDSFESLGGSVTRNELFLESLQRRDLMSTLTCQVSNNRISPPLEAAVTLDMHFRPLTVQVKGKRRRLSAQKPAQLECEARGSRPPAVLSWRKGSLRLSGAISRVSAQGDVTSSSLRLTPSSDDNGKFLYCQADNPAMPGATIEDGWRLDVHYVPQLNLRLGSKLRHSSILEGTDVTFECNIRANPWVTVIGWRFESRDLLSGPGVVVSNQSLVLQNVGRDHRGRYSCTATNTEGQGESNHVYLRIEYAPICKSEQPNTVVTVVNRPVNLLCEVEADADDVTFRWEFNGTSPGGVLHLHQESLKSTATYTPSSKVDFGTLFCWAINSAGTQAVPCTFLVLPVEPPPALQNCSISNVTIESFRVSCINETSDNDVVFHLEVRDFGTGDLVLNGTLSNPEHVVQALESGTWYAIAFYASNDAGRSIPALLEARTLDKPQKHNSQQEDTWNLMSFVIAFGGGILFVVFVLCCAAKLRSSIKESFSAQGNEKSTPNSEKSVDSCSEAYSGREEEKIRENIPDVVVFSEKAKSDDISYSTKPYWDTSQQETSPKTKLKGPQNVDCPWSSGDWVIPPQPVEMVTLQFHRSQEDPFVPSEGPLTTFSPTPKQTDV